MKKILYGILLTLFVLFPVNVFAEGYISVSPSSLTIEQGSSKTFSITSYNTIGDVSIRSNNSSVASVSTGTWGTGMVGEKETKSGSVTVTGNSIGTTTITLTIDAATFDGDDLSGQTKTITVNVVAKPTPTPTPTQTPTPQPTQPSSPNPETNLSKNNNIKSLSIEGHDLVKIDNNNYTLTVTNDVTSVNVKATAEDPKAKVTGIGSKELQVGENNIEVIITSESGTQNKINIKIIRKDGYYLSDLDSVLKNNKIQDADIIISADSKITNEQLTKIKDSKKTLRLNYYDKNKKLIYSWTIYGKEIKDSKEFSTAITFTTENVKEIYKLSNYADGLYINFNHSGNLPTGTKIKLYVGDKFENESIVNVYHYNNKTLDLIQDNLEVSEGYIEFDIKHCSEYFVTMSTLGNVTKEKKSSVNIFMISTTIELIIIIVFAVMFLKRKANKNKTNPEQPNIIEPKSLVTFNQAVPNQTLSTNVSNASNINNNMNSLNNNVNGVQNINKLNPEQPKIIEPKSLVTFNQAVPNQTLSTNVNNASNINNNMNSINNTINGTQNFNNSNVDFSNNGSNNLYQ